MAQTIYFDEAGFTGNHLLDIEQRFFAYASVATDDDEAKDFVESLIRRYNIQGGELKGGSLVRFNKGRKAIDELIKEFDGRLLFTIAEKKYTLACKFFEYIFEPCISQISTLFYGCDFHKFISTILYVEFMARGAGADQIFEEFQDLMRAPSDSKLEALFSSSTHPENSPILTHIREFAQHRIEDIREELESLSGNANGKWVLDLTCTSLHGLLSEWGGKFDVITAICDKSKPLMETGDFFDAMVGFEKRLFSGFNGASDPMTYNLSAPLEFRDSKDSHGIQLADALAAAAVHTWNGGSDNHALRWREVLLPISNRPILPDTDEIDLRRPEAVRNASILQTLHHRVTHGASLIDGMPADIHLISRTLGLPVMRYIVE